MSLASSSALRASFSAISDRRYSRISSSVSAARSSRASATSWLAAHHARHVSTTGLSSLYRRPAAWEALPIARRLDVGQARLEPIELRGELTEVLEHAHHTHSASERRPSGEGR